MEKENLSNSTLRYKVNFLKDLILNYFIDNVFEEPLNEVNIKSTEEKEDRQELLAKEEFPITTENSPFHCEDGTEYYLNFKEPGTHVVRHEYNKQGNTYNITERIEIDKDLKVHRKYEVLPDFESVKNFSTNELNNHLFKQIIKELEEEDN